jgi:hypothetical protein
MPAASTYWTFDSADRDLLHAADDERKARAQIHAQNLAYYDGDHRKPLKVRGNTDNNVILNLVAQAVDRTVAFLFPDMPRIELDSDDATTDSDESWLANAWKANGGAVLLANAALSGSLDGHIFLRVVPNDPDPYPRIVLLNGATVIAYWDADDLSRVLWYEIAYQKNGRTVRQDLIHDPDSDRWQILDYVLSAGKWLRTGSLIEWPYPLSPIVDFQHLPRPHRYYGQHELVHAKLNDAVNKVASDVKAILRTHASPKTIGTGVQASAVQETAIDSFWAIPNESAKVFNLEMNSDLASSMSFMHFLTEAFMAQSRVSMLRGGPDQFKNITNLGIKAAFLDMIAKNEILRRQYGQAIAQISQRLLMLGNRPYAVQPILRWSSALPISEAEAAQVAQTEIAMGVLSRETAAGKLGLDWQHESSRLTAEPPPAHPPNPNPFPHASGGKGNQTTTTD